MSNRLNYTLICEDIIIGCVLLEHPPRIGETFTLIEKNVDNRYWRVVDIVYQILLHEVQVIRVYVVRI